MKAAKAIGGAAGAGLGPSLSLEEGGAAQARGLPLEIAGGGQLEGLLGDRIDTKHLQTVLVHFGELGGTFR